MVNPGRSSSVIADVTHESRDGILVIRMVGRVGINVLMEHVMAHFDDWIAHDRLIYDLSEWNVESLTSDSLRTLHESFAPVMEARKTGSVALLVAPHLEGLAKILIAIYESEAVPVELRYFFDREAAVSWLEAPAG